MRTRRRLRRRLAPTRLAGRRLGGERRQERHRDLAQASLRLGQHNLVALQPLYQELYDAGVDITLAGHDHLYEHIAPLNADGVPDPVFGMRHFTVGTGGESNHGANTPIPGSQALNDQTFGVMKFNLRASDYDWQFLPIAGETFTDAGTGAVHDAPRPIWGRLTLVIRVRM